LTDGKQPLYVWFVIPFLKFIADPLAAGRTASVVTGLGTVLGMGYLGWLIEGKKTAFAAMILALFSPYLFFYYRFGVMESMLVMQRMLRYLMPESVIVKLLVQEYMRLTREAL